MDVTFPAGQTGAGEEGWWQMGMAEGQADIVRAGRDLENRWREMRRFWNDAAAAAFEARFVAPLLQDARRALAAMDQMNRILTQLRRDCE